MRLLNKSVKAIELYRLLFHIIGLALILGAPMLFRPEAGMLRRMPLEDIYLYRWLIVSTATVTLYFLNVYLLIPFFLKPGKYFQYALTLIAGFVILTFIVRVFLGMMEINQAFTDRIMQGPGLGRGHVVRISFSPMFPMLMSLALGVSFEMILNWEVQRKEKAQIEREKMASELSFLKSQVNPHFLFNSLNSIYALSEQNSPKTGEAILLLSNLMRYMLYGSNNGKTEVNKEVECIENYIALQKMRLSSREDIVIIFNVEGRDSKVMVEPLILIPFVENAFKHGLSYNQKSEVSIDMRAGNDFLDFHVRNTKKGGAGAETAAKADSGIGLVNIKRRLDLLYHGRYALILDETPEFFEIRLRLKLN